MLNLANPSRINQRTPGIAPSPWPEQHKTANQWFCSKYPLQARVFGSPFLEQSGRDSCGLAVSTPLTQNIDFFAACLGGDESLGHRVIYHADELQFYYYDPSDQLYHATTDAKLGNLYRALLARCASEVSGEGHLANVFHTFRSDVVTKSVVNRAKSLLEADTAFFAVDSQHERVHGPELHQRLARVFAGKLLEPHPGSILTVGQAFDLYNRFASSRKQEPIRRNDFKSVMAETIREAYDLGVRNDLKNAETQKQQCGWLGLRAVEHA